VDAFRIAAGTPVVNRDPNAVDLPAPCDGKAPQKTESAAREGLYRIEATLLDGVAIVVPQDRRDVSSHQLADGLLRKETIVDDVAGADDPIAPEAVDLGEGVAQGASVGVDVGNDPQAARGQGDGASPSKRGAASCALLSWLLSRKLLDSQATATKEKNMRSHIKGTFVTISLIGAAACSSGPLPAMRAMDVERLQCEASPASQDELVRSLKVVRVEPLYTHIMTGGDNAEERVNGAKMTVAEPQGVSGEQLARALQCRGARTLLGQIEGAPNEPYSLPDRWVAIDVTAEKGNFIVTLSSDTVRDNLLVYGRAHRYVDERPVASDPGLP